MKNVELLMIGQKAIRDWDRLWVPLDGGLKAYQPQLRYKVGLYRIIWNGQIMVLGTGTDKSGGIAKRLSDFRRPSPSGRNHHAGELINEHLDQLEVEVLITGSDRHAREIGRQLKAPMVELHRPPWNVAIDPPLGAGRSSFQKSKRLQADVARQATI